MHEPLQPRRHRLLARQLKLSTDAAAELDIEKLLRLVETAYGDYDHAAKVNHRAMMVAARELTELNETLSHARDAAEAASRAKSVFLANISHEIRTPLNAILGMAQAMRRDEPCPAAAGRLAVISEASRALVSIIDDILDISLVETGTLELNLVPMDLAAVVRRAVDGYADDCASKGISFSLHIDDALEGEWLGDAAHLERTLSVLTNNALKFTQQGEVRVEVRLDQGRVLFEVVDTGSGISEGKLSEIFGLFTQVDASSSRRAGGLGLGLAIAQQRVAAMGGDLQVTSRLNEGSVFAFALDLERCGSTVADRPDKETPVRSLRVLVAEDNPANQMVLNALWQPFDVELIMVGNGAEAVEAWKAGPFDLILMDIQMPVMSGLEASLEIRRLEQVSDRAPVPIVAITANVMSHQLASYHAAGINGCVAKPIQLQALLSAVSTAMRSDVGAIDVAASRRRA